ncbi:MAG: hypothetical protein ACOY82_13095 [Pseudomonadota bacterium]
MSEPTSDPDERKLPGPIAKAFYVLMAVPTLAFTGYNLWRLVFDGEIWIRYEGRFVPPSYDLYFWVTLLFYIVMFLVSAITLMLFFGWAIGRLRRRG